uniref:Uncharacterized protein n=1 Tax=Arundo donax TaxID=35708 RepID=A0A0A9CV69_ARUDO
MVCHLCSSSRSRAICLIPVATFAPSSPIAQKWRYWISREYCESLTICPLCCDKFPLSPCHFIHTYPPL